jgi:MFS family permease
MRRILPVIVISQFFCTSLWFAGNAVMPDIVRNFGLDPGFLAHLTSVVQFGFITGTLTFAVLTIADRFSPSWVVFTSSLAAAVCNLGMVVDGGNATSLLLFRFATGFFLAGIYPVGMKIASDHYKAGLGKSLGFLVGALVLGTALPHLIKSMTLQLPWKNVVFATSALSVLGGVTMIWLVPDGPYRRLGLQVRLTAFAKGFANKNFRAASFGYFGHMWELYTFWAFVPVMLATYQSYNPAVTLNVSLLSFCIIGSGGLACVASGFLSQVFGAKKIAAIALFLSGACCILSPLFLLNSSAAVFIAFLFCWGLAVIADSPLFSTLVAQNAPEESRGSSLTIVNCIGFTITIVSIQLLNVLLKHNDQRYTYMVLAIGPALGLFALLKRDKAR